MRRFLLRLTILTIAGLALGLTSCGEGKYAHVPETGATLEGTVTYKHEKVLVALVIVQGADTPAATGFIDEDGRFKIVNVPLGEVNIAVNSDAGKGPLMSRAQSQAHTGSKTPLPKVIDIPAKYGSPNTSGITTTIKKGENEFNIVISE